MRYFKRSYSCIKALLYN